MKHKRAVRNHPATDVVVGVVLEIVAVTILIDDWDRDSFWGTLFRLCLVVGPLPWLWWAIVYLHHGRPADPLSLYANDPEDADEPVLVASTDLVSPSQVQVFDQETMDLVAPAAPTKPSFAQVKVSIAKFGPVATWVAAGVPKGAVQGAIELAEQRAADQNVQVGPYAGDPRLEPGFWAKADGESEDDYWRRICRHDADGKPPKGHLLTCPDWKPRI